MFDKFHDECGVFAIYGHPEAANLAYLGLYALQHRGQESAGICLQRRPRDPHATSRMGHVADIFTPQVLGSCRANWPSGTRATPPPAIRCCSTRSRSRWPATRAASRWRTTATSPTPPNCAATWKREGSIFQASSDTEVILHLVARSRERTLAGALREALLQLEGAFSLVFLARGPHHRGARSARIPAAGHGADGAVRRHACATCSRRETCAFDLIGAVYLDDVEPGEMVIVGPEGVTRERYAPERDRAHCVFEHVYFSRPDSIVFGRAGAGIARDAGPAAGARASRGRRHRGAGARLRRGRGAGLLPPNPGMPFRQALIRNHYVGRTFIEPSQAIRDFGVKLKLNPVRHLLEGKRVVLVDDSIVRGTTSRKIVRMVRGAGAREVHLRISCPPTVSPCFYGVDTPTKGELIAANHTVEEIRRFVEADSLGYLSLGGAARGRGDDQQSRLLLRLLHRQLSHRTGQYRRADGGAAEAREVIACVSRRTILQMAGKDRVCGHRGVAVRIRYTQSAVFG